MDTSRVSLGEIIAAAGGLVLLVCMFLPWFEATVSGRGAANVPVSTTTDTTGWEAFGGVFDILIIALAAIPIGTAVGRASSSLPPLPLQQGVLVLAAGGLLFAIVGLRLVDPPDAINVATPGFEVDTTRKVAGFPALLAAAAVAAGGYLQRSVRRVGFEPTSP